jgi:hypothetical protein
MNYIQHLNTFLAMMEEERRFTPCHVSLYLALFHCWNCNQFENPFPLVRERLMKISAIGSRATYNKCLKELSEWGYIRYNPSLDINHRPKASMVHWKVAAKIERQVSVLQPKQKPDMGSLLVNIGQLSGHDPGSPTVRSAQLSCPGPGTDNNIKTLNEEEKRERDAPAPFEIPQQETVMAYFAKMGYPEKEAALFFHHYQANGWCQADKVPIRNWQAKADKWITYSFDNKLKHNENTGSTTIPRLQPGSGYEEPL